MSQVGKYGRIMTLAVAVLAIGGVAPAYAEAINVTSGNINFIIFDGASIGLNGPNGAALGGEIGSALFAYTPPYACASSTGGCAGQTVNLSISDSLTSSPSGPSGFLVEAGMSLDGVRYVLDNFSYNVAAGTVVTPLTGQVSTPFTFTATAVGTSSTGAMRTVEWTGGGTATADYGATMGWGQSNYTFSAQQVSATPEPASVLLFGTAIAGVFFVRRRGLLQSAVGTDGR
jgi:Fe-S cluster assembly iron-binding protein IscA